MTPCLMPKLSNRIFATGARQLVVQEALEIMWCDFRIVAVVVDAQDDGDIGVFRRGGNDHVLGSGGEVFPAPSRSVKRPVDSMTISTPAPSREALWGP